MSAVNDLKAKVTRLRDELRCAEEKWKGAMMAEAPFQPGDVIDVPRKGEVLISRLSVRFDEVRLHGRRKTKSGWHGTENDIWETPVRLISRRQITEQV